MDHNETIRKFERLMIKQAEHAHSAATEIEAMVSLLPDEKTRQLAQEQVKEIHKHSKDFRALAQKLKSS
jgi:metal-responsive CopG/Arc/MetJ family transcriptional regulator